MAEFNVLENLLENVNDFSACLDLVTQNFLTSISILKEIRWIRHNSQN